MPHAICRSALDWKPTPLPRGPWKKPGVPREPLLQFALLGCVLFLVHRAVAPPPLGDEIVVSAAVVHGLRADHQRRNGVLPSPAEEAGLVQRYVDGEMLYREALRLGLDRGDIIVRRRMIQKMELLADELADGGTELPDDRQLATYLQKHADRYAVPALVSFEHVFLRAGDSPPKKQEAAALAERIARGAAPSSLGDPFLHGPEFALRSREQVAALFGEDFADRLFTLPQDGWSPPMRSAYGWHLVRITQRQAETPPALSEVRERVEQDWREEREAEARQAQTEQLRRRYRVRVEDSPAPRGEQK